MTQAYFEAVHKNVMLMTNSAKNHGSIKPADLVFVVLSKMPAHLGDEANRWLD